MDQVLVFQLFSELLVNLAAGWFGVIFIAPQFQKLKGKKRTSALINNFFFGMLCVGVALWLRIL